MKRSKKYNFDRIIVVSVSILLIILFYFLNRSNLYKNELMDNSLPQIKKTKQTTMDDVIADYKSRYSYVETNVVNNHLTSILAYDEINDAVSFVYDNDSLKTVPLEDLIKKDSYNDFIEKCTELLALKYPSFIVDQVNIDYAVFQIKKNELVIYYRNNNFEPEYNGEVFLHVNYNDIDQFLNFRHHLDDEYKEENGFDYDPKKPTVAISFDDGPNNNKTTEILKALEDNKMCATFFMVGNKMNNQKEILRMVLASHSEIGSHTYSHINMKKVDQDVVDKEIKKTNEIFKSISGFDLRYVRPPYGAYKDEIIKKYPYSFILWNADTNDWKYKDTDYIVNYILDNAVDGNIILMHDSYETSVEAVKKALPILYTKGIQVVSVSKLAELKNKTLEQGTAYRSIQ